MSEPESLEDLRRKVAYFRDRSENLAAMLIQTDAASSALRHELEQKRRGFALLSRITTSLGLSDEVETFQSVSVQINPTLNMQRTAILTPVGDGTFRAAILQGYDREQTTRIAEHTSALPPVMLDPQRPALHTKASDPEQLTRIRAWLELPYLVATPVVVDGDIEAVIATGRLRERHPFMPRLGQGDAETVQAIAAFIGAMLSRRRLAEVEHLANHDPLTGLPNLRLGRDRLTQAIIQARRGAAGVALLYLDLDGFKAINDSYGHTAGDATLHMVGRRLQSCVRETDTVARIGGDEFLIILTDTRSGHDPDVVSRKILEALSRPINWKGHEASLGASIGIARYPEHGDTPEALIRRADAAMYSGKHDGKNTYRSA